MQMQTYNTEAQTPTPEAKSAFLESVKATLAECEKPQEVRDAYNEIMQVGNGEVFAKVPESYALFTRRMKEVKRGTSDDVQSGETDFDAAPLRSCWTGKA